MVKGRGRRRERSNQSRDGGGENAMQFLSGTGSLVVEQALEQVP